MDWRAVDKVAEWRIFKKKMTIIFIGEGKPMETRYVLVAGDDEAFNQWQMLKSQVENLAENLDAFWDAFEKNFEQTTTHWHYIDQYFIDFRQEPEESTADLDLCIKELVKGCKFPDDQVE